MVVFTITERFYLIFNHHYYCITLLDGGEALKTIELKFNTQLMSSVAIILFLIIDMEEGMQSLCCRVEVLGQS